MATSSLLARPYARAVCELAEEQNTWVQWSQALTLLAEVARATQAQGWLTSPRLSPTQRAALFIDVCGDALHAAGQRLVELLASNKRLAALPKIAALYARLRAEHEGRRDITVHSAMPLSAATRARLIEALRARWRCEVTLHCEVDAALIGGAVIRAGDQVIDGSVRGRLQRLAAGLEEA